MQGGNHYSNATYPRSSIARTVGPGADRSADLLRGLASREVYRDPEDRSSGGGLLHRRFTLTNRRIAPDGIAPYKMAPTTGGLLFCDTAL